MADNLPLLGFPAAGNKSPRPPVWTPAATWTLAAVSAVALALVAWRGYGLSRWSTRPPDIEKGVVPLAPLDLNRSSATDLENVPGLGPVLAGRIVEQRQRQGDFRSLDELRKVQGIGPATLERIRPFLHTGTYTPSGPVPTARQEVPAGPTKKASPANPIDVNRASAAELRTLPGIGPTLAARIVEARSKQRFRSVDDLRKVRGIGAKTLQRLRPHVTVGQGRTER
jgi:competence protein ComEA